MDTKELLKIMDFISKSDLNEVSIETGELKINVKKNAEVETRFVEPVVQQVLPQSAPAAPVAAPAPSATPAAPASDAPAPAATSASDDSKYIAVKSPMIGTFYRSANPESPMFVNVGDKVESGQTVCIIEAMKLFNEIESEISGTIVKVLVENAQPVEYDQPLFLVEPN